MLFATVPTVSSGCLYSRYRYLGRMGLLGSGGNEFLVYDGLLGLEQVRVCVAFYAAVSYRISGGIFLF